MNMIFKKYNKIVLILIKKHKILTLFNKIIFIKLGYLMKIFLTTKIKIAADQTSLG